VHSINLRDYSLAQVDAWAPEKIDKLAWSHRLSRNFTIVAEQDGIITGFASLITHIGYYDLLYIHRDYQGQGIATALTDIVEKEAALHGIGELTTDASITVKHFFEKKGTGLFGSKVLIEKDNY
jgi:putative acetyltransferase